MGKIKLNKNLKEYNRLQVRKVRGSNKVSDHDRIYKVPMASKGSSMNLLTKINRDKSNGELIFEISKLVKISNLLLNIEPYSMSISIASYLAEEITQEIANSDFFKEFIKKNRLHNSQELILSSIKEIIKKIIEKIEDEFRKIFYTKISNINYFKTTCLKNNCYLVNRIEENIEKEIKLLLIQETPENIESLKYRELKREIKQIELRNFNFNSEIKETKISEDFNKKLEEVIKKKLEHNKVILTGMIEKEKVEIFLPKDLIGLKKRLIHSIKGHETKYEYLFENKFIKLQAEISEEDYEEQFNYDFYSKFFVSNYFLKQLKEKVETKESVFILKIPNFTFDKQKEILNYKSLA